MKKINYAVVRELIHQAGIDPMAVKEIKIDPTGVSFVLAKMPLLPETTEELISIPFCDCDEVQRVKSVVIPAELDITNLGLRQYTLGSFFEMLGNAQNINLRVLIRIGEETRLVSNLVSWRGRYAECSIDSNAADFPQGGLTVGELFSDCASVLSGRTLEGWKGGDFTMNRDTRLWADEAGTARGFIPVHAVVENNALVIYTVQTTI